MRTINFLSLGLGLGLELRLGLGLGSGLGLELGLGLEKKQNCKMMSKFIKMKENKVVIGLLILSMSIIVCLTHLLRP